MRYDLCLPWYWEYDDTFAGMVERACIEEGISLWQIKPDNLLESITALYKGITTFKTLLPRQLKRLAKRATIGMARTGSLGGNGSGDIFLAFSTANPGAAHGDEMGLANIQTLSNDHIDPLLSASALATEEAIINSMIAAEDMSGHNELRIKALPHKEIQEILKQYNR